jgi:pyruvate formate lyase activating enzyme
VTMTDASLCRIFNLQRFSIHDGPGIRTTVFMSGCSLRCVWCQNPEAFQDACVYTLSPQTVIAEVLKDIDYYKTSGGGLTVSGGEPLLNTDMVVALLTEAKQHKLHTCVQTSGSVPQKNIEAALSLTDLFQFDLKHMDSGRHRELTGAGTELIHRNAAFLLECDTTVQFRMPLLPGINNSEENLILTAKFLLKHNVQILHIVPYHRLYLDKYKTPGIEPGINEIEPPSDEIMQKTVSFMKRQGVDIEVNG